MYAHTEYFQKYMFHLLYMYLLLWSDTMSFATDNFYDLNFVLNALNLKLSVIVESNFNPVL